MHFTAVNKTTAKTNQCIPVYLLPGTGKKQISTTNKSHTGKPFNL